MWGIYHITLSVPQNIIMDLNNVNVVGFKEARETMVPMNVDYFLSPGFEPARKLLRKTGVFYCKVICLHGEQ